MRCEQVQAMLDGEAPVFPADAHIHSCAACSAHLARLDLGGRELDRFAEQVGSILDYMDTLNKVDTRDVEPTSQAIQRNNAFREDVPRPHLDREQALANAPEKDEGSFLVPKIISG